MYVCTYLNAMNLKCYESICIVEFIGKAPGSIKFPAPAVGFKVLLILVWMEQH